MEGDSHATLCEQEMAIAAGDSSGLEDPSRLAIFSRKTCSESYPKCQTFEIISGKSALPRIPFDQRRSLASAAFSVAHATSAPLNHLQRRKGL